MRVMAAMSGGVDSSVAAALLLSQGYTVCGATLKLFDNEDIGLPDTAVCSSLKDIEDARRVADKLGIAHYVFDFGELFKKEVIARFAKGYAEGVTPNPCIECNRCIKFGKLLEHARLSGWDAIATGHYARVEYDDNTGRYLLKRSADESKDQTYVLYSLTQDVLAHTVFPLGGLHKDEVRRIALEGGFANANKPDSQDICFVKDGDYAGFLEKVWGLKSEPGDFTDSSGKVLGRHRGLIHYTIGQRKGLNLSLGRPVYVVSKDVGTNTVVIGDERELYSDRLYVTDLNIIPFESLEQPMRVSVKTRYTQICAPATIFPPENGRLTVIFDTKQRAVTPGQAAVFYDRDYVVGGGRII